MKDVTISVIIPVYNVQEYLNSCVESVVSQTYRALQIILVNDGSTDESGGLCDAWATLDERIMVIHQKNGGLSAARNTGVRYATGEYVLFLDSDDFWDDTEAVAKLMRRVEQTSPDVLQYSYKKYTEGTGEKVPYFSIPVAMPLLKTKDEQIAFLVRNGYYIASACNKLVKRSLLTEELQFREGVYSEDIEWCAKLMLAAKSMDFIPEAFYCYRMRKGSISNTVSDKKCTDLCDNVIACFRLLEEAPDEIQASLSTYLAFQYATFFAVQALAGKKQTDNLRRMKPYRSILSHHGGNRKVRVLSMACRVIGYDTTCWLMRRIYRKRA